MKKQLIFLIPIFYAITNLFLHTEIFAIELDEVYKYSGKYLLIETHNLRIYYPDSIKDSIPRIFRCLKNVREKLSQSFPHLKHFKAKVILTDRDDRDSGIADSIFDLISLGIFEETDSLSTRSYSLEQRFAYRLAYIMILRSLGSSKTAIKRRISMLSIPSWFLEGLALYYAFPMDSLHACRLLEMVRGDRLFTMNEMDTLNFRETYIKEQIIFQARSMIEFLHQKAGQDAGTKFLTLMNRRPIGFAETFKEAFGMSLKEAFHAYNKYIRELCEKNRCKEAPSPQLINSLKGVRFIQSIRSWNGGFFYVSSKRYTEEVYDLYYKDTQGKTLLLLKNVHPVFLIDQKTGTVFIGKYSVNRAKERRLNIWAVSSNREIRRITSESGSFKPLVLKNGKLFYLAYRKGLWSLKSIKWPEGGIETEEYRFPKSVQVFDAVLDNSGKYCFAVVRFLDKMHLVRFKLDESSDYADVFLSTAGVIRRLYIFNSKLWFVTESNLNTLQLFSLKLEDEKDAKLVCHSALPGGIWDYCFVDENTVFASTIGKDGFLAVSFSLSEFDEKNVQKEEICFLDNEPVEKKTAPVEYRTSYWLPKLSYDDRGAVWGIYTYRADTLDRSRIILAPTYGFKSRGWGYSAEYMHRFNLLRADLWQQDKVLQKSYLSNSYYERVRSTGLSLRYPFSLATTLIVGGELTKRGIAKFPDKGGVAPTVGRDHSIFFHILHKGIRTEPNCDIFPRKGREYLASYRKGLDIFNGELKYDSMSLRWNEYIPLAHNLVLKLRGWIAEDDKETGLRRPEDLTLGGIDFLRGYPSSVRYGDSLRAVSIDLGAEIPFSIPSLQKWVHKEIIVFEVFWERGDVKSAGKSFDFLEDAGFEVRAKGLLLRRVPVSVRFGAGRPRGGGKAHSYWGVDFSAITSLIR